MKYLIITAILILLFFLSPVQAEVSNSGESTGGSVISIFHESFEASNDLGPGWYTGGKDYYQNGGTTSRVVTDGDTSLKFNSILEDSLTSAQVTSLKSTGKVSISQSGGISSTQTNISPTDCTAGDIVEQGSETSGRYAETQDATTSIGMMGGGNNWYDSEILVDDKSLSSSVAGGVEEGFIYANSQGRIEAGLDQNTTSLQYTYKRSDRLMKLAKDHKLAEAVRSFIWDISADQIAGNETETNETSEENDI
jgi:hypothetical protein